MTDRQIEFGTGWRDIFKEKEGKKLMEEGGKQSLRKIKEEYRLQERVGVRNSE